jgi:hypothetical protein
MHSLGDHPLSRDKQGPPEVKRRAPYVQPSQTQGGRSMSAADTLLLIGYTSLLVGYTLMVVSYITRLFA